VLFVCMRWAAGRCSDEAISRKLVLLFPIWASITWLADQWYVVSRIAL
jgi:hypothetical protein